VDPITNAIDTYHLGHALGGKADRRQAVTSQYWLSKLPLMDVRERCRQCDCTPVVLSA